MRQSKAAWHDVIWHKVREQHTGIVWWKETHLIVAVSGYDFLQAVAVHDPFQAVAVHDPFHKLQVGTHESDVPLPTTWHRAAANQRRGHTHSIPEKVFSYHGGWYEGNHTPVTTLYFIQYKGNKQQNNENNNCCHQRRMVGRSCKTLLGLPANMPKRHTV